MPDPDLSGCTVGITADRRGSDQEVMFRRFGAEVVRGPMMSTVTLADESVLREVTARLIESPPDYLVANTGLGMRTWFDAATAWGEDDRLRAALASTRIVARGPKSAGAVSAAKLETHWRSPSEQLADVVSYIGGEDPRGKTVAFQLHGDDGSATISKLESAGATVVPVPVYRWSLPSSEEAGPARELIRLCCEGSVDAVTFTAGPQVRNMFELADAEGVAGDLRASFAARKPLAGCIGPVCAGVAAEEGIADPVVPEAWRLGSLVRAVGAALTEERQGPGR